MPATDPVLLTACELLELYRRKTLSPVEATKAALDRIDRLNPVLNAYCLVDHEGALEAARASEARWQRGEPVGRLDGVPSSVKDVVITKGWPTLRGSRAIDPKGPWDEDSPANARLGEHKAVILGKTTTPEFGWKGITDSPLTGITRNPWNLQKTPGGSSGGASAAAAVGMGALHVGTDGGGSIRIPAGFTGIVGHKPSGGRVPAYPSSPYGDLAHLGPMTRSVADAALMLSVMGEPDPRDPWALPDCGRDMSLDLDRSIKGLRIAYCKALGGIAPRPEVAAEVDTAVQRLRELGAEVEVVDSPFQDPDPIFRVFWFAGAARVLSLLPEETHELIDPGFIEVAREGASITLVQYQQAVADREKLIRSMGVFHARYDLLVTATLPDVAFDAGIESPTPGERWTRWTPYSYPINLTRQPAISVPCGFVDGLPVGLQIVGPFHNDGLVLRAARAFEAAAPIVLPPLEPLLADGRG